MRAALSCTLAFLIGLGPSLGLAHPPPTPTHTGRPASGATLTDEKLDSITAPLALYPDALLAQVLMASTYPDQVTQAAKWSKQNPNLEGDEAVKKVQSKPWDPSVQSLVAFPQVLATLAQKPEWVKQLGNAFLSHPDAVMDSVQRLRAMAQQSGNLKSDEHQSVQVEQPAPDQTIIKIEPANPEVVYVPSYSPEVYGAWPYPSYPPMYVPPPYGYGIAAGLATGLAFGVGIGVRSALWGGFGWGHHDVNINTNRYNNINTNRQLNANQSNWRQNNQSRINNARANTNYSRTQAGAQGRGAQRTRAQQAVQRRQPGAYQGGAQQRAQGIQRSQTQQRAQGVNRGQQSFNRGQQNLGRSSSGRSQSYSRPSSGSYNRGSSGMSRGSSGMSRGSSGSFSRGSGMSRGGGGGRRR
jgi:hypothetical protein